MRLQEVLVPFRSTERIGNLSVWRPSPPPLAWVAKQHPFQKMSVVMFAAGWDPSGMQVIKAGPSLSWVAVSQAER